MLYLIIVICIVPLCITMFTYSRRKRGIDTLNSREILSYSLQHDDEFYSVKRSKSALKKSNSKTSKNSRKSVQFNEVVLEVFDLIDEENDDILSNKPSYPKIVKSSLKNEKVYLPIRCSNTIFPKTIINEYNGEIINFNKNDEKSNKENTIIEDTKINSNENEFPEIVIIKDDDKKPLAILSSHTEDTDSDATLYDSPVSSPLSDVAKKVITSEANSTSNLFIDNESKKSNTIPRRSRPKLKGHRRQSSVRLTCIY